MDECVYDVVFVVCLVVIIVVLVDTCCCCDLIIHGDLLMCRKLYGYVLCRWPSGGSDMMLFVLL